MEHTGHWFTTGVWVRVKVRVLLMLKEVSYLSF